MLVVGASAPCLWQGPCIINPWMNVRMLRTTKSP